MKITNKEVESVSMLDSLERYKYFIKRVADTEMMYTLVDAEGDFALDDVDNNTLLSLWPASEFAVLCATDIWSSFSIKELTLEEFEDELIDKIEENKWLLNVFSVGTKSGFVVDINEFAKDLSEELKKYH